MTRLKQLRAASGLSLDKVAKAIGMSKTHLHAIEREKHDWRTITLGTARKLEEFFGVPIGYLFLGTHSSVRDAKDEAFIARYLSLSEKDRKKLIATCNILFGWGAP